MKKRNIRIYTANRYYTATVPGSSFEDAYIRLLEHVGDHFIFRENVMLGEASVGVTAIRKDAVESFVDMGSADNVLADPFI